MKKDFRLSNARAYVTHKHESSDVHEARLAAINGGNILNCSCGPVKNCDAMPNDERDTPATDVVPGEGATNDGGTMVNEHESYPWSECIKEQEAKYGKESAEKICVLPDTFILGDNKAISEYSVGNTVVGRSGLVPVVDVMKRDYNGELVRITARGMLPVVVTPNHPILVVSGAKKYLGWDNSKGKKLEAVDYSSAEWKVAESVEKRRSGRISGDYLVIPRVRGNLIVKSIHLPEVRAKQSNQSVSRSYVLQESRDVSLTEDVAWLMGNYVAEGCTAKSGLIQWASNRNERSIRAKLLSILVGMGLKPRERMVATGAVVLVTSKQLEQKFKEWFGIGAANKKIPDFIAYNSDDKIVLAFLKGYEEGDGHVERVNNKAIYHASTVSKTLALQLQMIYARFGWAACISLQKRAGQSTIQGRNVTIKDIYRLSYQREHGRRFRHKVFDDSILWPVNKIEKVPYCGQVWNIATGDETYLVSNAIVHNCGSIKAKYGNSTVPMIDAALANAFADETKRRSDLVSNQATFNEIQGLVSGTIAKDPRFIAMAGGDIQSAGNNISPANFWTQDIVVDGAGMFAVVRMPNGRLLKISFVPLDPDGDGDIDGIELVGEPSETDMVYNAGVRRAERLANAWSDEARRASAEARRHPTQVEYDKAKVADDAVRAKVDAEKKQLVPFNRGASHDEIAARVNKEMEIEKKHGYLESHDRLRKAEDAMVGAAREHLQKQPEYAKLSPSKKADIDRVWKDGLKSIQIRPKLVSLASKLDHRSGVANSMDAVERLSNTLPNAKVTYADLVSEARLNNTWSDAAREASAEARKGGARPVKFAVGDTVHVQDGSKSGYHGEVARINKSDDPNYEHAYAVKRFDTGQRGKWANETSLTKASPYVRPEKFEEQHRKVYPKATPEEVKSAYKVFSASQAPGKTKNSVDVYARVRDVISNGVLDDALRNEFETAIRNDFVTNAGTSVTLANSVTPERKAEIAAKRKHADEASATAMKENTKEAHDYASNCHKEVAGILENCGHAECIENAKKHRDQALVHDAKSKELSSSK